MLFFLVIQLLCWSQDFKNGKVDTAFIVKHEEELAEVNSNVSVVG